MSEKRNYRRRSFISNPREQWKIIAAFAFLGIAFAMTNWLMSMGTLSRLHEGMMSIPLSEVARRDTDVLLDQNTEELRIQLLLFTVVAALLLVSAALYMSHKIGGPIHQLTTYFRDVAEGRTPPRTIRFRKYDFFQDLPDTLNEFQKNRGIVPPESSDANPTDSPGSGARSPSK